MNIKIINGEHGVEVRDTHGELLNNVTEAKVFISAWGLPKVRLTIVNPELEVNGQLTEITYNGKKFKEA